jgi:hypothetical protein
MDNLVLLGFRALLLPREDCCKMDVRHHRIRKSDHLTRDTKGLFAVIVQVRLFGFELADCIFF